MWLKADEIKTIFKNLAKIQGLYGRMLSDYTDEDFKRLEDERFPDVVSLIMFIES